MASANPLKASRLGRAEYGAVHGVAVVGSDDLARTSHRKADGAVCRWNQAALGVDDGSFDEAWARYSRCFGPGSRWRWLPRSYFGMCGSALFAESRVAVVDIVLMLVVDVAFT